MNQALENLQWMGPHAQTHWMPGGDSWGGHMMTSPFGGTLMILVLAVVIFLIVAACRGRGKNSISKKTRSEETALEILKKRYAAGEIDKEEFDRIKKDLE